VDPVDPDPDPQHWYPGSATLLPTQEKFKFSYLIRRVKIYLEIKIQTGEMSSPKHQTQQTGPSFESPRPTPRYEQRDESRIHALPLFSRTSLKGVYNCLAASISSFNYVPLASPGD
jgi:hypothetical protein